MSNAGPNAMAIQSTATTLTHKSHFGEKHAPLQYTCHDWASTHLSNLVCYNCGMACGERR